MSSLTWFALSLLFLAVWITLSLFFSCAVQELQVSMRVPVIDLENDSGLSAVGA